LSVQVEGDQLIVRGRRSEPQGRTYLHRGIAARQFKRRFQLANGFQVESAHLENGMLAIDIRRATTVTPVQKIAIR
jgi:HSP20 family molecular chaperone IbpA